jgi:glutamine synthetase adenylyltransferase
VPLVITLCTKANIAVAKIANVLQRVRTNRKTVVAVVALAGAAADIATSVIKYPEQLSRLAKCVINEAQGSCTRAATAVTGFNLTGMEHHTGLTTLQVWLCSLLHHM